MTKQLSLTFSLEDFNSLYSASMRSFLSEQLPRFELVKDHQGRALSETMGDEGRFMYWLDTKSDTMIACKILEAAGYRVSEFWDLVYAESNIDDGWNQPPHVLVTDYAGPCIEGLEVAA
mgnify:FL=1